MTYFPSRPYPDAGVYAADYFSEMSAAAASVDAEQLRRAGDLIEKTVSAGGVIYSCGNGGSAAIANHLACDCLKGIRNGASIAPRVVSLAATVELITAIANDLSYEQVFAFQLSSLAKPGDLLIAISSSGESPNIVSALNWAKGNGVGSISMTGFAGGQAAALADVNLHVSATNYGVVEDMHQSFMHLLAQYVRHKHLVDATSLGQIKF
jgi:phosphoheptose isomerase